MIHKSNRNPNVSSILAQLQADTHPAVIDFGNITFFGRSYGSGTALTAQYTDKDGKRKQFYAKTTNAKDAEKAFKAFLIEKTGFVPNNLSITTLLNEFIEYQRGLERKIGTIVAYQDVLKVLVKYFGDVSVGSLDKSKARDFVSNGTTALSRTKGVISPATLRKYIRHLKAVWEYGCEYHEKEITSNIWKKLKLPIVPEELKETPSDEEFTTFRFVMSRSKKPKYARLLRICEIASATGLRIGQVRTITESMIDFDNNILRVPASTSKISKAREIHLTNELAKTFKVQIEAKKLQGFNSVYLFPTSDNTCVSYSTINDLLVKILKRLNLRTWTSGFHGLRRQAGITLSKNGETMETLQKMYGHSTSAMTESYTQHSLRRTPDQIRATELLSSPLKSSSKLHVVKGLIESFDFAVKLSYASAA